MKTLLFFFFTVIISAFAQAQCSRSINNKKIVVFMDTNKSEAEVKDAEKAACLRGEKFMRLPKEGNRINAKGFSDEMKQLASQNIAVTSIIASGHNGGGYIHGLDGNISKYDIAEGLKSAYSGTKAKLLDSFNSIFMWGCWSMGNSEIDYWNKEFPQLRMAAGFIEMAPLNATRATHTVLHDLLLREKSISEATDKKRLKRLIDGVRDINQTYAAVFSESACGNMYYYNMADYKKSTVRDDTDKDNILFSPGNHFIDFDKAFNCAEAAKEIESNRKLIIPYFYGKKPLPPNNSSSEILQIYSFIRSHSKCLKFNHVLNGDRIGLLRFFDDVKKNFAITFANENAKAVAEFNELSKFLNTNRSKQNPQLQQFLREFEAGRAKFFSNDINTLMKKERINIMEMISYLDGITRVGTIYPKEKVANLKKLKNAMNIYLFQLDPDCMNFLTWHEYSSDVKPIFCDI